MLAAPSLSVFAQHDEAIYDYYISVDQPYLGLTSKTSQQMNFLLHLSDSFPIRSFLSKISPEIFGHKV